MAWHRTTTVIRFCSSPAANGTLMHGVDMINKWFLCPKLLEMEWSAKKLRHWSWGWWSDVYSGLCWKKNIVFTWSRAESGPSHLTRGIENTKGTLGEKNCCPYKGRAQSKGIKGNKNTRDCSLWWKRERSCLYCYLYLNQLLIYLSTTLNLTCLAFVICFSF